MAKISVIIPTRNRPEYLAEAVASVLSQRDCAFEVIIVNDGDPLMSSFVDARVRVVQNPKQGAVNARNFGLAHTTGEIIAFLDDDDFWQDGHHLAKADRALANTNGFYFANGIMLFPDLTTREFFYDATVQSLATDNTILISAVCYSKALHDSLGVFDAMLEYYWDWDWYLRVARSGAPLVHQPEPAVTIRVHAANMSGPSNVAARQAGLDALCAKHKLGKLQLKAHVDFV